MRNHMIAVNKYFESVNYFTNNVLTLNICTSNSHSEKNVIHNNVRKGDLLRIEFPSTKGEKNDERTERVYGIH